MSDKTVIHIEKTGGKLRPESVDVYREAWETLPDGWYRLIFEAQRRGYTTTRYKYYFAHVMETILLTCGDRFEIMEGERFRKARNTQEIHEALKMKYNPVLVRTPFATFAMPSSTTGLSDSEFINAFEETIIADFSAPPFGCDFMSREDWAEMMKGKRAETYGGGSQST